MRRALAAVLALACLSGVGCDLPDPNPPGGAQAPAFSLPDLDGRTVSLADFRGRTVVIDFWATWCTPCIYQIPVLNELHAAHPDGDVAVLGISVDAEGREVVAPFADEHEIAYPVLLGDEALARRYGAPGFPALAVVRPDGVIDSMHVGLIDPDELAAAVAQALAGGGPADSATGG